MTAYRDMPPERQACVREIADCILRQLADGQPRESFCTDHEHRTVRRSDPSKALRLLLQEGKIESCDMPRVPYLPNDEDPPDSDPGPWLGWRLRRP